MMIVQNPDKAMRALIEAAKTKVNHAANLARGKSAFWYLLGGGVGVGALLAGAGILCGGYSYVVGNKVIAQQVAEGVKAALATTTLETRGTVTGEVGLKEGGQVAIKEGGAVHLDPNAVVRVAGQVPADVPRPSPEQVRQDEPPASQAAAVTNFTRFYTVPFGAGEVQTAWVYRSSEQQTPSEQTCMYLGPTRGGAYPVTVLGRDGRIALPASALAGVDLLKAASLCAWTGSAKAAPAPSPTNLIHAKS